MSISITRKERPHGDCPTQEFERGLARGRCEGDGHFLCPSCRHYKEPEEDVFPEMVFEMGIAVTREAAEDLAARIEDITVVENFEGKIILE